MKRYNMLNGMDRGRTGLEINKFGQIDNWIQVTLSIQCSATIETFITPEGHSYHTWCEEDQPAAAVDTEA